MGGASAPSAPRCSSLRKVSLEESSLKRMETNSEPAWLLSSHETLEPPLEVTGPSLCNLRKVVRIAEELGKWALIRFGKLLWGPAHLVPTWWCCPSLPASQLGRAQAVWTALEFGGVLGVGQGSCRVSQRPLSAVEDTHVCSYTCLPTAPPHYMLA